MGQLERYGLYVLCLVIFLILGVAVMGPGDSQAAQATAVTAPVVVEESVPDVDDFYAELEEYMDRRDQPARAPSQRANVAQAPQPVTQLATQPAPQAAREPVRQAVPEVPLLRTYKVRKGDNLEDVSKQFYGRRTLWKKIAQANGNLDPKKLRPGMVLKIPTISGIQAPPPSRVLPKTYKVVKGDSPAKISKKLYGTETYADEIMTLNHITDPRSLRLGMDLKLPAPR